MTEALFAKWFQNNEAGPGRRNQRQSRPAVFHSNPTVSKDVRDPLSALKKEVSVVSKVHSQFPIDKFRKSLQGRFRLPDYQLHTCQSDFFRHNGGSPVRKESFAPGQAPRSPVLLAGPRSLVVILGWPTHSSTRHPLDRTNTLNNCHYCSNNIRAPLRPSCSLRIRYGYDHYSANPLQRRKISLLEKRESWSLKEPFHARQHTKHH